jgi:hypothetical protein
MYLAKKQKICLVLTYDKQGLSKKKNCEGSATWNMFVPLSLSLSLSHLCNKVC